MKTLLRFASTACNIFVLVNLQYHFLEKCSKVLKPIGTMNPPSSHHGFARPTSKSRPPTSPDVVPGLPAELSWPFNPEIAALTSSEVKTLCLKRLPDAHRFQRDGYLVITCVTFIFWCFQRDVT